MNAILSRKIKVTVKISNPVLTAMLLICSAIYMFNSLHAADETEAIGVMSGLMGFGFGAFYSTFTFIMINSLFFAHVKQLRTMPFTRRDVKDIALCNIFYHLIIFTAWQCFLLALMRTSAIPAFICINLANADFSVGYLLLCLRDNRNWDVQSAQRNEMSRKEKAGTLTVLILIMLCSTAVTMFLYCLGWSKPLGETLPVLAAVAAAAVTVLAVETAAYMKKEVEF